MTTKGKGRGKRIRANTDLIKDTIKFKLEGEAIPKEMQGEDLSEQTHAIFQNLMSAKSVDMWTSFEKLQALTLARVEALKVQALRRLEANFDYVLVTSDADVWASVKAFQTLQQISQNLSRQLYVVGTKNQQSKANASRLLSHRQSLEEMNVSNDGFIRWTKKPATGFDDTLEQIEEELKNAKTH